MGVFAREFLSYEMVRLSVAEGFSVILEEGGSGEKDFYIDQVVFYLHISTVDRLDG